jgi:class 3 adenylate cyclase
MLANALDARSDDLGRARLLPSFVEAAVAAGELDSAHEAADELMRTAAQFRTVSFRAAADEARARVLLARGELDEALKHAREALRGWLEVDAPYEAAHARLLVAEADGDHSSGVSELETALSAFERLGAVPAGRRAQELLARRGRSGQRAGRTFLFTDIAGSTGLLETIGDQAWERLAGWHDRTLRACFAAHEGEEIDQAGDGFFVSFPDAMRAIDCALTIQRSLEEHRRAHGFAPQVRIGLHAAEATRSGQSYRGKGVHEAARIAALAQGGEILASLDTVRDLERIEHGEPRAVELKGLTSPLEVVSISWG